MGGGVIKVGLNLLPEADCEINSNIGMFLFLFHGDDSFYKGIDVLNFFVPLIPRL